MKKYLLSFLLTIVPITVNAELVKLFDDPAVGQWYINIDTFKVESGQVTSEFRVERGTISHDFILRVSEDTCETGLGHLDYNEIDESQKWEQLHEVDFVAISEKDKPTIGELSAVTLCVLREMVLSRLTYI